MTDRTRFEAAMRRAGWSPLKAGLFGFVRYWQHRNGYEMTDWKAYKFWRRHGQTPTPF